MDVTTVADDLVVIHDGTHVNRFDGLEPDTEHVLSGVEVRTLPRPPGELLCRVATVNDLHFGEVEAGRIDERTDGPIQRVTRDEDPYPETMNHGAVAEFAALVPAAVVVKATCRPTAPTRSSPRSKCVTAPSSAIASTLWVATTTRTAADAVRRRHWIDLPGVSIALLDMAVPGGATGSTPGQLDWLDARCATADRPVLVMGHHQQWVAGQPPVDAPGDPRDERRNASYFGIHPDPSDALDEVAARRRSIV